MAKRPLFAGWPPRQPPAHGQNVAGEFRPGMSFQQHSPRPNPPVFHQFPPRGPGHGIGYPSNDNPQGWSVYPRGYPAMVPSPRTTSPTVIYSQLQNFAPGLGCYAQGNIVSAGTSSQGQGQQAVQARQGLYVPTHDGRRPSFVGHSESAIVPWSSEVRTNSSGKPLFLNWIDEGIKDSSSPSQLQGDSGGRWSSLRTPSHNLAVPKSSDLYRLVEQVEETISKIVASTNLQTLSSGREWGVCPFDPDHVVPVKALLRHTLQCPSSLTGTVDTSSLLNSLQYPHTVQLDPSEPLADEERMTERHLGAESSSNYVTLSFENAALFRVSSTSTRRLGLGIAKQESGDADTENSSEIPRVKGKVVGTTNWSKNLDCRSLVVSTGMQQFDPRGSLFFYREAPGVVLTSSSHHSSKGFVDVMSSLPHSLRRELEKCPSFIVKRVKTEEEESHGAVQWNGIPDSAAGGSLSRIQQVVERENVVCENDMKLGRLLPSTLWNLERELEGWKDMPSQCSRIVLEAATGLGRMRKASIVEWLLMHSPLYGIVLDVAMAAHVSCLVQLYLKALRTQSLLLLEQGFARGLNRGGTSISSVTNVAECPIYAEAGTWLASWLSRLYGPINGKAVVLDVLKHCLKSCGRFLSVVPLDLYSEQADFKTRGTNEDVKDVADNESKVFLEHSNMLTRGADNTCIHLSSPVPLEDILEMRQIGAAMDAIYERCNFEGYIKSWMSIVNVTKPELIANYDIAVMSAKDERARRPIYRAVCEHDGLTWQRSHQEEKISKTKAELLAEERDYKRRRLSYRGKKPKRTPMQVLHDIIENHMTEITEAGGIGCFSKQPLHVPFVSHRDVESQQQVQESVPSKSDLQHHFGNARYSERANSETAGNVSRPYKRHRETSSAARHESRTSSRGRYADEGYRNSKR